MNSDGHFNIMSAENIYKNEIKLFCKHINKIRIAKGLTQKKLNLASGITQSQISLLENPDSRPNPEFETLVKLAWGFKIEMAFLYKYLNPTEPPVIEKKFKTIQQRTKLEKQMFGLRVEELYKHRKLKQDEFAILAKIDAADISRYVNGDSNIEFFNLVKIASALEVSLFMLFDYDGPLPDNKGFKGKL